MVKEEEIATVAGVPQGGPISPTIANMVLDGLEKYVKDATTHLKRNAKLEKKKTFSPKVNVIRYRDDFVITAANKRILTD